MANKNFLIYKLLVLFFFTVIANTIPGMTRAMDLEFIKPEYIGTSLHYGTETDIILYNSDYVDYDNRQTKFFAGKKIADSWRMEYEFVVASIREHRNWYKKDETLFGFQAGILYDFLRIDRLGFYILIPGH